MSGEGDGVAWLVARQQIADLVHRYALNVRTGNHAACTDLFTEDAFFEMLEAPATSPLDRRPRKRIDGREAVVRYLVDGASTGGAVLPMIHNLLVELDDAVTARGSCLLSAHAAALGITLLGEYADTFRREDGAWRFSSRTNILYRS